MNSIIKSFSANRNTIVFLGLIIGFYVFNGIYYLQTQSLTYDEGPFYYYAVRYLKGQPERINPVSDNSKTPIIALNTLPRIVEELFGGKKTKTDYGFSDVFAGRYISLFASLFIILFVFQWSKELYGKHGGLFSALLISLCPGIISNSALVTTDIYSVLSLLATMYFFWKFWKKGSMRVFILFSVSVAVAQLVKQSLFHLYVVIPLCFLCLYKKGDTINWKSAFRYIVIFLLINLFIINAGYYFYQSGQKISAYYFKSDLFISTQKIFPSWLPVPFPKPFIEGLDMAKYYDQIGGGLENSSFGKVTILGNSFTGRGVWYYYIVTLLYKTPISYFVLLLWAILVAIKKRTGKVMDNNIIFLFLPVLYFLFLMSFFYKTQCGLRHVIFIYPLITVYLGSIINNIQTIFQKSLLLVLSVYLFASVLSYWKNYYPYTNELITTKKFAYKYVGASNLNYSGNSYFVKKYLREHPEVKRAPHKPQSGFFVITVSSYLDNLNLHTHKWLECYEPIAHIGHSFLLLKVDKPCLINPMRKND